MVSDLLPAVLLCHDIVHCHLGSSLILGFIVQENAGSCGRVGQSLPHCISQCHCLSAPQQFGCRMFHNSEESVGNYSSEEPDKVNCPTCAPLLKQKDMSVGVGFDAEDLNCYSPRDRVVPWFMLKKK